MNTINAMLGAINMAQRSTCVRRQVGAVLLDGYGIQRGTGFNTEADDKDCRQDCPRGRKTYAEVPAGSPYGKGEPGACIADHAEMVALWQAAKAFELAEMRLWTMVVTCEPCNDCQLVLEANHILVVYEGKLV